MEQNSCVEVGNYVAKITVSYAVLEVPFKISLHDHAFTYTVNGNTITASCGNADCDATQGLSLTLSAPTENLVYDGKAKYATLNNGYNTDAFENVKIVYTKEDGTEVNSCIEVGKYFAKVTVGEKTIQVSFTIENWKNTNDNVTVEFKGNINVPENVEVTYKEHSDNEKLLTEMYSYLLGKKEKAIYACDIKLVQDGKEIQPSKLKESLKATVTINIPKKLVGKKFKVMHVHLIDEGDGLFRKEGEYLQFTLGDKGRTVTFEVENFSDFVFVKEQKGSGFGVIMLILDILACGFLAMFWLLTNTDKLNALVEKMNIAKYVEDKKLLNIIGMGVGGFVTILSLIGVIANFT